MRLCDYCLRRCVPGAVVRHEYEDGVVEVSVGLHALQEPQQVLIQQLQLIYLQQSTR